MKIRYYLLLVVGLMTTLVFLGSFITEGLLLRNRIQAMRMRSTEKAEELLEKRRGYLAEYVEEALAKRLAKVNSVLEAVSSFKNLSDWFVPTKEHISEGTWSSSASLIQQDEWIHFIQNTGEGKLLSAIVPEPGPFFKVQIEPAEEGIAFVHVLETNSFPYPFIGVEVPLKPAEYSEEAIFSADPVNRAYMLFSIHRLKGMEVDTKGEVDGLLPLPGITDVDEARFAQYFAKAVAFAKEVDPKRKNASWKEIFLPDEEQKELSFKEKTAGYQQAQLEYSSELFLLWQTALLKQAGAFSEDSKGNAWPDAFTFNVGERKENRICFLEPIIGFKEPLFDDAAFFKAHLPKEGCSVSSGSAVIQSPTHNQAFLANTVEVISRDKKRGLLTIGFDIDLLVQDIVSNFHQYGFVVSDKKVVINRPFPGSPMIPTDILEKAIANKVDQPSGNFTAGGKVYYFSKIEPDPSLHMAFFLLEREDGPSLVFRRMQEVLAVKLKELVAERNGIEFLSLMILWGLLLYASKRITGPIVALSSCFRYVKGEEWEKIRLPQIEFKKNNEIKKLYDAFYEMVQGLKEKKKVTSILNKVVSEEVAQEILKGDIKLGGEERSVSIFFADIRGFTHLTQNMPPHEVIEFLNKCMTKISLLIEKHQGVIDKYMGDGIMAIYGAPIAFEKSGLQAIATALEITEVLEQWNCERKASGLPAVEVGIGIHTGPVCAGNMGAKHRLNYTVIGSNVNMASRLCGFAKGGEVLITEETYLQEEVKDAIEVEAKGQVSFKGFDAEVKVYKVVKVKGGSTP